MAKVHVNTQAMYAIADTLGKTLTILKGKVVMEEMRKHVWLDKHFEFYTRMGISDSVLTENAAAVEVALEGNLRMVVIASNFNDGFTMRLDTLIINWHKRPNFVLGSLKTVDPDALVKRYGDSVKLHSRANSEKKRWVEQTAEAA